MFYVYGCDIRKSTLIGALVAIISLYFNNILFRLLLLLYKNAHFQKYYYCNFRLCEYMQTFYYSISNPYLHNQHLHLQIRLCTHKLRHRFQLSNHLFGKCLFLVGSVLLLNTSNYNKIMSIFHTRKAILDFLYFLKAKKHCIFYLHRNYGL